MMLMEKLPSGERVVLVPCSASSARQWRSLSGQLVSFQPVPIDLWGHGNQHRWHGSGPPRLSEQARAIQDVCPDGAPFHLVGHSCGGAVALQFALSHPERLHSLTLIEPSCFHVLKGMDAQYIDEIRAVAEAVSREVICGDYLSAMKTFITYWGGVNCWDILSDEKKAQFAQVAVHVAHHFWSLIEDNNKPLTAYANINVPTLILCGTHSPAPSRLITRLLTEAMPLARHRTIPYADHMSPINRAAEVNALILEHLLAAPLTAEQFPKRLYSPARPFDDADAVARVNSIILRWLLASRVFPRQADVRLDAWDAKHCPPVMGQSTR